MARPAGARVSSGQVTDRRSSDHRVSLRLSLRSNIALQQTGSLVAYLASLHPTARKARAKPALRAGRPRC